MTPHERTTPCTTAAAVSIQGYVIKEDLPYGFDDVSNDLGAAGRLYALGDNALAFIDNLKVFL